MRQMPVGTLLKQSHSCQNYASPSNHALVSHELQGTLLHAWYCWTSLESRSSAFVLPVLAVVRCLVLENIILRGALDLNGDGIFLKAWKAGAKANHPFQPRLAVGPTENQMERLNVVLNVSRTYPSSVPLAMRREWKPSMLNTPAVHLWHLLNELRDCN